VEITVDDYDEEKGLKKKKCELKY